MKSIFFWVGFIPPFPSHFLLILPSFLWDSVWLYLCFVLCGSGRGWPSRRGGPTWYSTCSIFTLRYLAPALFKLLCPFYIVLFVSLTLSLSKRCLFVLVTNSPHDILCLKNFSAIYILSKFTLNTCTYKSKLYLLQISTKGVMSGKNVADKDFVPPSSGNGLCNIIMIACLPSQISDTLIYLT